MIQKAREDAKNRYHNHVVVIGQICFKLIKSYMFLWRPDTLGFIKFVD